jgi:AcrR family transcriptional regulator
MEVKPRLKGEERKVSIVESARPLFAAKGFSGTSVRQIARAANVSEALLYKHFPSKHALYKEVQIYPEKIQLLLMDGLEKFEPGTEKLVLIVFLAFHQIIFEVPGHEEEQKIHERLLFQSFLEDGSYARKVFKVLQKANLRKILLESLKVAEQSGHLLDIPISRGNRLWFSHHLAMALNLCHLKGESVFEYQESVETLVEQAVFFALRGIGLTDAAMKAFFKPDRLRRIKQQLYERY